MHFVVMLKHSTAKTRENKVHIHGFMFGKRFFALFQGRSASVEERS